MRGPADADQQAVRPIDPYFVQPPFAVPQDAAGPDNEILYARGNGGDIGCANEHAEGIVLGRHAPRAGPGLRQMHLTPHPAMIA